MTGEREACGHRFHVRLVMVSNDRVGRDVCTGQGLPKKRFRTGPVAFVPQENIDHLPVLITRAIQVEFALATKAKYFVHRPSPPDSSSMLSERGG